MKTYLRILLLLTVLALLAACGESAPQATATLPVENPPTSVIPTEPGPPTETSLAPTAAPGDAPQLTGRTWTWVRTEMNDGTVIEPRQPEEFTLTLTDNGQVVGTTDCNDFSGTYTTGEGGVLSFEPFVSTMMLCESSQETDFVSRLQEVQSYMFADGMLVLMIRFDSGTVTLQ